MVAPKSHSTANAASADKSEDVANATELLFSAMLGLLGTDASKLLEASVPPVLIKCYDEVSKYTKELGYERPEMRAAVITTRPFEEATDLLFSTLHFSPDEVDEYVARHYANKKAKFLGLYKNYGYIHLVETSTPTSNV